MSRLLLALILSLSPSWLLAQDWPVYRGPSRNGHAEGRYPTAWTAGQNIAWKITLPGLGNSSPIVVGDRVYVAMSEEKGRRRSLRSYDRRTGRPLWSQTVEFTGQEPTHETNPYAGSTPASNGERIVVWHGTPGLYCYDLSGNLLWKADLGPVNHIWGYGASPVIHDGKVFLNVGPGKNSFLVALDLATGKELWRIAEPDGADDENPNATGPRDKWIGSWSTPLIAEIDDRAQLVIAMPHRMEAFDPQSGESLWKCSAFSTLCYADAHLGEGYAVGVGGYGGPLFAFKLGGHGENADIEPLWKRVDDNPQRIGSGVIHQGCFYIVNENGVAQCYELATGKETWKARLPVGGTYWASLIVADDKIYAFNQSGKATLFAADPTRFKFLAENECGEGTNATPAFSGGQIFYRGYSTLLCISEQRSSE